MNKGVHLKLGELRSFRLDKMDLSYIFLSSNSSLSSGYREISSQALRKVRVEDIPEKGLDVHFSDPKEEWNRYLEGVPGRDFSIDESVEATIRLSVVGEVIRVQGRVGTVLSLQCCRCLEIFPHPFTSQIDIALFPETGAVHEEEVELESEDLKSSFFSEDEIDLSGLIREQIILNIPYKALCHEACRGLCCRCGANLNAGACGCEKRPRESAFDVLKKLKLKEE
jgi:uncharacterized protein